MDTTDDARDEFPADAERDARALALAVSRRLDDEVVFCAMETIEALLEEQGWDAPWSLWGIFSGPHRDDQANLTVTSLLVAPAPHPYDGLMGYHADPALLGVMLASEGWTYRHEPGEVDRLLMPSEHPDRVELRILHAVLADGRIFVLTRHRGNTPKRQIPDTQMTGRLPDVLRRTLAVGTEPTGYLPGEFFARAWLAELAECCVTNPPTNDAAAIELAVSCDPALSLVGWVVTDPRELAEIIVALRDAPQMPDSTLSSILTEASTKEGAARLQDVAAQADIDPLPEALRAKMTVMWESWSALYEIGARSGIADATPEQVRWMGPDMLANRLVESIDAPADTLATVQTLAPVAAEFVQAVIRQRGWPLDGIYAPSLD